MNNASGFDPMSYAPMFCSDFSSLYPTFLGVPKLSYQELEEQHNALFQIGNHSRPFAPDLISTRYTDVDILCTFRMPSLSMFRENGLYRDVQSLVVRNLNLDDCIMLVLAHSSDAQQAYWLERLFSTRCFLRRCRTRGHVALGRWAIAHGCTLLPERSRYSGRDYSEQYREIDIRFSRSDMRNNIVDWCFWYGTVLGMPKQVESNDMWTLDKIRSRAKEVLALITYDALDEEIGPAREAF